MSSDAGDNSPADRAIVADSAEEYTDKSRLRSLFEARDAASQAIRKASMQEMQIRVERGISERAARNVVNSNVRESVSAYVLECEPLLRNSEDGRELLNSTHIHDWRIPGDRHEYDNWEVVDNTVTVVDDSLIRIVGLENYLSMSSVTTRHFQTVKKHDGYHKQEELVSHTVSRKVSEKVFRELNLLMADLGIGLEAEREDADKVAEYDYSDLI